MIDTLEIGMRCKIRLGGNLHRAEIIALDDQNSCFHARRDEGSPRVIVCSYPMLWKVWSEHDQEWEFWRLPSEEEAEFAAAPGGVGEQKVNAP